MAEVLVGRSPTGLIDVACDEINDVQRGDRVRRMPRVECGLAEPGNVSPERIEDIASSVPVMRAGASTLQRECPREGAVTNTGLYQRGQALPGIRGDVLADASNGHANAVGVEGAVGHEFTLAADGSLRQQAFAPVGAAGTVFAYPKA